MGKTLDDISKSKELVELVSCTENGDHIISFCARVSNPNNQTNFNTAPKLLKYLIDNKHWSPFELAHMTVQIKTSRAIAAQILRHRSFTFQEFSQRYAVANEFVKYPARRQDKKNRQNSIDDMSQEDMDWFNSAQQEVWDVANKKYEEALAKGIAKEQARFLLPLNTSTTVYMSGSIRSWIHYIQLRSANGTQKEHADIAIACRSIISQRFPDVAEALGWNGTNE